MPKGDRVRITMSGEFLPDKYHSISISDDVQKLGTKAT
ncbi:hypothetical protein Salmuc_02564 [Salipiger mucosus DSM 16094]|uniref:Uncharacterized protein n=1 Tax=Salipiger mucosus DSM 16094 TaxID=1123237 RepID=S9QJN0_9RHOB|nr:hypothetical protein Salmuc_02564 [Salipiger mucosus DSM 16094]